MFLQASRATAPLNMSDGTSRQQRQERRNLLREDAIARQQINREVIPEDRDTRADELDITPPLDPNVGDPPVMHTNNAYETPSKEIQGEMEHLTVIKQEDKIPAKPAQNPTNAHGGIILSINTKKRSFTVRNAPGGLQLRRP